MESSHRVSLSWFKARGRALFHHLVPDAEVAVVEVGRSSASVMSTTSAASPLFGLAGVGRRLLSDES